jgi:predicted RNase H-like HicB family nuclease
VSCRERGKTPLSSQQIAQLFGYIQLLEGALAKGGRDVGPLRNRVGLGVGPKGTGFKTRRAVRAELARLEKEYLAKRRHAQRAGWRGRLPFYTARLQRARRGYVGSVDEMPGVYGEGRTVAEALRSLTGAVDVALKVSRTRATKHQARTTTKEDGR